MTTGGILVLPVVFSCLVAVSCFIAEDEGDETTLFLQPEQKSDMAQPRRAQCVRMAEKIGPCDDCFDFDMLKNSFILFLFSAFK